MNADPRPSSEERERRKSEEALRATQKAIAKLWRIHDKLRGYPESEKNVERLRRAIERLHEEPFSPITSWKSLEETWLDRQVELGSVEQEAYYYLLDCMTSEERYDEGEAWSRHLREAIIQQQIEVPLPAEYERDPNGPTPYERLVSALSVLKDNPREMMGDVWIDRAVHLGLIPRAEARRYLDIFIKCTRQSRGSSRGRTASKARASWSISRARQPPCSHLSSREDLERLGITAELVKMSWSG